MNRQKADKIRDALEEALRAITKCEGAPVTVKIEPRATYDTISCTFKITVLEGGADDAAKAEYLRHAFLFGFSEEHYGQVFTYAGSRYTVHGFRPKSRLALLGKRSDGKLFKFEPSSVKASLVAEKAMGAGR